LVALALLGGAFTPLACEPQAVRLFSGANPAPDAGSTAPPPAETDAGTSPAPEPPAPEPPAREQPECRSAACDSCTAERAACLVAGTQWLCHPWTGECALPCDPSSTTVQCPRQQRCHPDYGLCVGCVGASDCSGAAPACDTVQNACVECTGDENCSGATPACDTDALRCVVCVEDSHCGAGQVCERGSHTCVQCRASSDCATVAVGDDDERPICDLDTHTCVECLSDDDCTSDSDKPFCKQSELECDDERE
jgi:Cys-rich repeat protein